MADHQEKNGEIKELPAYSREDLRKVPFMATLAHINAVRNEILAELRGAQALPDGRKHVLERTSSEAAAALGRSLAWLNKINDAKLRPDTQIDNPTWRSYRPEHIMAVRRAKAVPPFRKPTMPAAIVAITMQKGGVGKTTTALTLTHYLASRGFRVLLVDADGQASNTGAFEIVDHEGKLLPCGTFSPGPYETASSMMVGDSKISLRRLVRKTHWSTIDIIPSSPNMARGEMDLIIAMLKGNPAERAGAMRSLSQGLKQLASMDYDIIVVDTPPGLSVTKVAVDLGVDGVIVPVPMRMFDATSLFTWSETTEDWIEELGVANFSKLAWVRMLPTMFNRNSLSEIKIMNSMKARFGELMLPPVPLMEALKRGSASAPTVYEAQEKATDRASARKARTELDEAYEPILDLIGSHWV